MVAIVSINKLEFLGQGIFFSGQGAKFLWCILVQF